MPKQKMVKCPKCRRPISAQEFRSHMLGHQGKKLLVKEKVGEAPPILENKLLKDPKFKDFFNKMVNAKPQMSDLNEKQIRQKFEKALKDVKTTYTSLRLQPTNDPDFIQVIIDTNRNLTLKYSPLSLRTVPEDRIDALLLHEACHVSTLPDTNIRIPDTGNSSGMAFMVDSITNYHEYLAHSEFCKKFGNDNRFKALREQEVSLFEQFEIIVSTTKTLMETLRERGLINETIEWKIREQINAIVYDSIFLHVSGDELLANWFHNNSLEGLYLFTKWIYEDLDHINKLGLTLEECDKKAIISGTLGMSVNPYLLIYGKIDFRPGTKQLHEEMLSRKQEVDLVELWEARRKKLQP